MNKLNTLKDLRIANNMTQQETADTFNISLRSYNSYENDETKRKTMKYKYMFDYLKEKAKIDEEHGIITIEEIKKTVTNICKKYNAKYCYLFGSYAKNTATETSDIDLLISTDVKGIKFYGIVELLREELHKKVDLLESSQLINNKELLDEIMKDGIKIYG